MPKNHETQKLSHFFCETMTDLFKTCFEVDDDFTFSPSEPRKAVNFFLYITKYNEYDDNSGKNYAGINYHDFLSKALCRPVNKAKSSKSENIIDILNEYTLNENNTFHREAQYKGHLQKKPSELSSYCKNILGLDTDCLKTQDDMIDMIALCFSVGCHGISQNMRSPLNWLAPLSSQSKLKALLNKNKTPFTVIYGNAIERYSCYMYRYSFREIYDNTLSISYENYIQGMLIDNEVLMNKIASKYNVKPNQLSHAIMNIYLKQKNKRYLMIYDIPSQKDLDIIISEANFFQNVILVCNFDLGSFQNNESVSYIPFQQFYTEPNLCDVEHFCKKNSVTADNIDKMYRLLLEISKGNLRVLHTLELYVKNVKDSKTVIANLEILKDLSKKKDSISSKVKFNLEGTNNKKRSGYTLIGHIRNICKNILSSNEWILLLLVALYGENGLPKKFGDNILPEQLRDKMASLIAKGFVTQTETAYIYEDSLLIPYALGNGKTRYKTDSFEDIFKFINNTLCEICYYNCQPLDYEILCITIKKTSNTLFSLMHKDKDNYSEHFADIWYYHIRCIRFFLENGDANSIDELNENFKTLAEKILSRPGNTFKHWKKLYDTYISFLSLCTEAFKKPQQTWDKYIKLIDSLCEKLKKDGNIVGTQPFYWKLLICLIELMIHNLLYIYILELQNQRMNIAENAGVKLYANKVQTIITLCTKMQTILPYANDASFILEMGTSFQTMSAISYGYLPYYNNSCIIKTEYKIDLKNFKNLPLYKQLALFQINCIILNEYCYSGYAKDNQINNAVTNDLYYIINEAYHILEIVPMEILGYYYYSLISYVLALYPYEICELLKMMRNDLKQYSHIWHNSEILSQIHKTISEIEKNNDNHK